MIRAPVWPTACDSRSVDTTPMELAALSDHMALCTARSGRLFAMQCSALRLRGLATRRLVTTLAVLAVLAGAGLLFVL